MKTFTTYEHKIDEERLELEWADSPDEEEFDDDWTWEEAEAWEELDRRLNGEDICTSQKKK